MRIKAQLLVLILTLNSCTTVPLSEQLVPMSHLKENAPTESGYRDVVGATHIHTSYSDGSGSFQHITEIAQQQNLDYLIVTDHDTLQPMFDGKEGWYGETLVLTGTELTTPSGHYLAFNLKHEIPSYQLTTQETIDAVKAQGGLGFIAHPFGRRPWTDWSVHGYNGIEIHNASHDTLGDRVFDMVLWTLTSPSIPYYFSILKRPTPSLEQWDHLHHERKEKTVGIGGTDAHEYRALWMKFAPYEIMFRLVRNHALLESEALNKESLLHAYEVGHIYTSIELTASAQGFMFAVYEDEKKLGILGDSVDWKPGMHLKVHLPSVGHIYLFRDGQVIADTFAEDWQVEALEPGIYRVEVTRHDKPWIYSNPITLIAHE